jgi:hypothetical protein
LLRRVSEVPIDPSPIEGERQKQMSFEAEVRAAGVLLPDERLIATADGRFPAPRFRVTFLRDLKGDGIGPCSDRSRP